MTYAYVKSVYVTINQEQFTAINQSLIALEITIKELIEALEKR